MQFLYVDIASIEANLGSILNPKLLLGANAPSRARKLVRADDVIFATTRPYLRNVAIVPSQLDLAVCSTGFCVLRAKEKIEPRWIYWVCRSNLVSSQLLPKMRGANYPAVTDSDVFSVHIPVPPYDIQHRIITRLEALLAELTEMRDLVNVIRQDTDRVMGAAIEETFSEVSKDRRPLIDVLEEKPRNGWSPQCDNNPAGTPVLKLGAVLGFRFDPLAIKRTSLPVDLHAHYWLEMGDIMISRSNTPDLVGHAAVYSGDPYPCIYPDLLMKMRAQPTKADPQFIVYWLQSREIRTYIAAHATGASSTMKKITQGDVSSLPFPIVGMETQRRIVAHLNAVEEEVREMRSLQTQDAELLDQVEQSILERAFRGEL
ncbi:MAG: restriction endonuclease subunit S [Candidatus Binatia bacterium]